MNTTKPYDQQQQQQQQGGYTRPRSASVLLARKSNGSLGTNGVYSASSTNLGAPVFTGRPLPKTPGMASQQPYQQQQQQHQQQTYFDSSSDNGKGGGYNVGNGQHNSNNNLNNNDSNNGSNWSDNNSNGAAALSGRSGKVNIHVGQPSNTSPASASANNIPNNNNSNVGTMALQGHVSWVQPMATSSPSTSFSSTSVSNKSLSPPGVAYSIPGTLLTKTSQQHLHQQSAQSQGPNVTQDEASSYYAALTRPISPTMIMNYVPPPVSNSGATPLTTATTQDGSGSNIMESPSQPIMLTPATSSLRPLSATAALSSSFNTLGPGSQLTARPTVHQGARSSYMEPSNPPSLSSSNQTPQQGRALSIGGSSIISAISNSSAEDPSSSSSRFARRGPLVMSHVAGSFGDHNNSYTSTGTRSRRESGAWSDADSGTPAQNLYRQSFHQQTPQQHYQQQQLPFSPATPRTDMSNMASPVNTTSVGMQIAKEGWLWRRGNLLTWKRCYAIGRFRGDAHPGILTLFKDNEHLFPIKTIDMAECYEVQVKAQDTKGSGRFEFKLVTRKEETWFATDTMSERTGWIDGLNSLMSKAVGASLLKLEAKLNSIRHRNNSLEYSIHTDTTGGGSGGGNNAAATTAALEGHLQLVQRDLATREQQLSQREQELERKRIESLLVQLEAWRAAAKVTLNQHYAVRDQLLERVMKTARTVQELLERARVHLETGSDQITEVVNSHLECIRVHAGESSLNAVSYKMIKSILVGLSVNLDTRSSEMKRVLLVLDQFIRASKSSNPGYASNSSPASPRLVGARERRISVGGPLSPSTANSNPPSTLGIGAYLTQVRNKYTETLEILEDHSKRLKRILERADINNPESARRFQEDVKEILKSLTRHPTYTFTPCLPDHPLPGAADTFYREDLVVIQQKNKELLRKTQVSTSPTPATNPASPLKRPQFANHGESDDDDDNDEGDGLSLKEPVIMSSSPKEPTIGLPAEPQSTGKTAESTPSPTVSSTVGSNGIPKLNLAFPASLSSFLLSEALPSSSSNAAATMAAVSSAVPTFSSTELTQKLRDTILPEFDHLTLKQEESLQSMTTLLNQVSSALVKKLVEIKDATAGQRQEFEELKDEIIDVMQLSATDPSAHQRDISTLSEIRSKLADITSQLTKVQTAQQQQQSIGHGAGGLYGGSVSGYRRVGGASPSSGAGTSAATATGFSLLQRSASTMVHNSVGGGAHQFHHTTDSGSRQHLQRVNSTSLHNRLHIPSSTSMMASLGSGGGLSSLTGSNNNIATNGGSGSGTPGTKPSKIAGMTRLFEESDPWTGHHAAAATGTQLLGEGGYFIQDLDYDSAFNARQNQQVAAKLDQLLLLLEFVNTAQCRMMAYQDLEYDRHRNGGGAGNVDDGRMMAVQEHMEQMDRKMNLQMHLLRRLASIQDTGVMSSAGDSTATTASAKIKQIDGDDGDEEAPQVGEARGDEGALQNEGVLTASIESLVRTAPPENELTLLEVLSRLDLQVIPSVKDQSERIHELSDQLSEMKRQLNEQHKRQELLLLQQASNANATVRSRSVAGTSNIGRSNSMERPVTPLLHSRSASQTLVQQQQQHQQQGSTSALSSPLETESPASWRASLRPSQSNGSNSASFRDRILSVSNVPPLLIASPLGSLNSSQAILQDPATATSTTTGSGGGTLVTKTSDRIAELLDRMDNKMGQVIDEQLARYESGNKALLAKVFELLEADEELLEGGSETTPRTTRAAATSSGSGHAKQGADHDEQQIHIDNNTLLKDVNKSSEEMNQTLGKILRGQEELLKINSTRPGSSIGDGDRDANDSKDSSTRTWADSLDRIKTLIQQEGDRSEASLSDQRDEILDKMNQVLSSIQDTQTQFGSRDGQVKEELQELRDWMVRHSSQQTENLRELFLFASTATTTVQESGGAVAVGLSRTDADDDDDGDFVDRGSNSNLKVRVGDGDEEEYTEVDILEDLDKHHHRQPNAGGVTHPGAAASASAHPPIITATTSTEIQELKDQLEMFTKVQMATFSELADNVSGVEKMMRDMSKMMGVRRGGTILRRKEADEGRAMLAMEVKETIQEVIGRMSSTGGPMSPTIAEGSGSRRSSVDGGVLAALENRRPTSITTATATTTTTTTTTPPVSASAVGAPSRGESGLFKYLYQARRSTSSTSTESGTPPAPVLLPTAPAVVPASPRVDVTAAARKSFSSAPSSPVVRTPTMTVGDLHNNSNNCFYDDHDNRGSMMTSLQMQMQLELHQNQIEQLYKRKARAEIEVEDLQSEKVRLFDEKVALREEVEQLRRERQELLLLNSGCDDAHVDGDGKEVSPLLSSASFLEKILQDRVSLLLQETARLEKHKQQLERETR